MTETTDKIPFQDRSRILEIIGGLLLFVGIVCAFMGPIELYCFYLFSEGGRFHYPGFGFGSFMFALIAWQIIGYYLIAGLCLPLGYGHLKKRRWARTLTLSLLWLWLVAGVPVLVIVLFMMLSLKELTPITGLLFIALLGLAYPIIPGLLIRFYGGERVRLTFETRDPNTYWTEKLPLPILVLGGLLLFYALVLHVPIFFNGILPFFGRWLSGLTGIFLLDLTILGVVALAWGVFRRKSWAWWGTLAFFALLTASTALTLIPASWGEILSAVNLPPTEMEAFQQMPLQGYHLVALAGLPLLLTLATIILSKGHFRTGSATAGSREASWSNLPESLSLTERD